MLSADLLTLLREWWKAGRRQGVSPFDRLALRVTEQATPDS